MSLLTIQEALNEINGSTGLTQQEAANELAVAVAAVASSGALTLTNTTTDNTISVDQNGNVGTAVATDGAVHIENTGNTGIGLGVYSNIGATADAELVSIKVDNAAFDKEAFVITNDGAGTALKLVTNSDTKSIALESTATASAVFDIYNNAVYTSTTGLIYVNVENSSSSGNGIRIKQDGTGAGLNIDHNGGGKAIYIDHDDTGVQASIDIDRDGNSGARIFGIAITVDNAGAGNLVGGIDFSGMSDTEPLFKLTSTDTDLSTKSPETDAEAGWFPVLVGTTTYAVPIYALS